MYLKVKMEHLRTALHVILSVPTLWCIEYLCHEELDKYTKEFAGSIIPTILVTIAYYFVLAFALSVPLLPSHKLVNLYMYLTSGLLLYAAYYLSSEYVADEKRRRVKNSRKDEDNNMNLEMIIRSSIYIAIQSVIAVLIAYLTKMRNLNRICVFIFALPLMGLFCGVQNYLIDILHNFTAFFSFLIIFLFVFMNFITVLDEWKDLLNQFIPLQVEEYVRFVLEIWHSKKLSIQLSVYWIVRFFLQSYLNMDMDGGVLPVLVKYKGLIFALEFAIGMCCTTKVSLIAFCVTISYVLYWLHRLTWFFLQGFRDYQHDIDGTRGRSAGFYVLIWAYQNRFLDLTLLQKPRMVSCYFFMVVSILLQSIHEMCEPILLSICAQYVKSISKNLRAIILFLFLWMFPIYMAYSIYQYYSLNSWLPLVILSNWLLMSVQVSGSLTVYTLSMYGSLRTESWDSLNDVIYNVRSTVRKIESIVVLLTLYELTEYNFELSNVIPSLILIFYCCNLLERSQRGWETFLSRREAVNRLESLPTATKKQLKEYNHVCGICNQSMTAARITQCKHLFHATCLKKWLYVKDACPMCPPYGTQKFKKPRKRFFYDNSHNCQRSTNQ